MRTNNEQSEYPQHGFPGHGRGHTILIAALFIMVGLLFLGNNLGMVDPYIFNIVISWQMLLIVLGIFNLFTRRYVGAFVLMAVGAYFLVPQITGMEGEWLKTYWPVLLIMVGIGLLFKQKRCKAHRWSRKRAEHSREEFHSEDGFVVSENIFGSVQQIVLDPVFKGARIKCTFGGTVLDLRRTSLDLPETIVDVECTFGGVEIYVPVHWNLQTQIQPVLGGTDDKRFGLSTALDQEHVLIVRGNVVFGGIEFKN